MMKLLIILGLAMAATATSPSNSPQTIRLGSVSAVITDIEGSLVPKGDASAAVPVFEFKSSKHGVAAHDTEFYTYRCNVVTEFYKQESNPPVLICRNLGYSKGNPNSSEKTAFLFTHSGLHLAPNVKEIEVVAGKSAVSSITSALSVGVPDTRRKPVMEGVYDGFKLVVGMDLYDSLLTYTH